MSGFPERIKAEINKTVNHIQRLEKDQPEGWTTDKEKCVNDLVKTIEKSREDLVSDTETLLHLLADERTIAEACPEEVVHAILTSKPELILMAKGRETIPLKEFIKRGFKRMPKIIIQFMTTDVKKHSLFELGCKAAQADEVEIHTETYEEIQKAAQETGREVIQAAFDFYVPKDLLPLDVDLLEKLVRLSNPDMLRKGTGSSLSPLQQILRYDLCVENPEKQLALVKCILDKNEEGINDRVEATTQVKLGPRIVQGWKSQHSVYQWHAATRKLWHDHQNKQATVNSDGNKRAVSTVNGVPQSLRKIRGADLENGMQTKPTPGGKEGKMQAPISQSTSTMGSSPHSTLNSGKPGMSRVHAENNAARANLTEYPYSEGGMGKEGLNSPSSRPDRQNQLSTNSRTGAKQRNVEEANRASEALLQELGLRFLRWTLLEPCDAEIDSAIQKFFGDDKYRAPSSISMDTAVPASEQLWFKYVQDFVSMIPELDDTKYAGPQMQRVRVALIDDGVDYFSRGMHSLQQRIIEGQSFDTNPDDGPNTAFSSAIRAAISDQVDIISMSWTIHRAGADDSTTQLRNLIGDDNNKMRIPILFCAASDDGNRAQVPEFPRNIGLRTFCIGAADSSGQVWPSVTGETHFIFPGVDIKDVFGEDALTGNTESTRGDTRIPDLVAKNGRTGSSVATALAAGLAALLIHCTKLGLHYTEQCQSKNKRPDETISAKAVASISTAEGMDAALKKLSNMSTRGTRYTNPGDVFKKATEGLKRFESNGGLENRLPESLGPIATLVRNLCDV
ncbi:hypothetical protein SLS64_012514 [Diaporthe eres]